MVRIVTPHAAAVPPRADAEAAQRPAWAGRRQLPAYGKALLARRRADEHPMCVHLVVGNDWRRPAPCTWSSLGEYHPLLALKPEDCEPGRWDWRPLAAVNVVVVDQEGLALDVRAPDASHPRAWGHGPLYALLGEIAQAAADVELVVAGEKWPAAHFLAAGARNYKLKNDAARNHGWPAWWSESTEQLNAQRRQTWCRAALIERLEPETCAGQ